MSRDLRHLTRRMLLARAGMLSAAAFLPGAVPFALARPAFPDYPFRLGVASGDPVSDGFVLWTRLAPDPLNGGGMPVEPVEVHWVVASDERLGRVVQRGVATAHPDWAHSVHVEVQGLEPGRPYWYQFRSGTEVSPVGRTRTTPVYGGPVQRLRFAFASCQHYEQGFFTAYRHMAADDPDLVLHLGDYIYETASNGWEVRRHDGPEPVDLDGYRSRHALYKMDADLQAAHAAAPWVMTWDDHEVENDYAGAFSEENAPAETFLRRRAAAYRAYWEHMPLRRTARPVGPDMRLHQRLTYGDLVRFNLLDMRQYRADQACGTPEQSGGRMIGGDCAERADPARSALGVAQERWLIAGLDGTPARWNVIAQQMLMAPLFQKGADGGETFWSDAWDGYPATRERILGHLAAKPVRNPVVIGGDIHSFWVTDLKADLRNPDSPTVATEFVGTSISSQGVAFGYYNAMLPANPHIRLFESRKRGYVRVELTPEAWRTDLRVLDDVRDPASGAGTLASFVIESGRPGAQRA